MKGNHTMNMNHNESPFGEVIYTYSRSQAVANGVQVDVTKTAQEAGIKFPMFLTRAVFDQYVAGPLDLDDPQPAITLLLPDED